MQLHSVPSDGRAAYPACIPYYFVCVRAHAIMLPLGKLSNTPSEPVLQLAHVSHMYVHVSYYDYMCMLRAQPYPTESFSSLSGGTRMV